MTEILFTDFIYQLKERLQKDLPGLDAHIHMAPPHRFKNATEFKPKTDTRNGGVLILLYPREGKIHFPMIQRPEDSGVHSGQISFPGGKQDENEDIDLTALRETWEEVGVEVKPENIIGKLSSLYIPPSNFLVFPVIAAIDYQPEFNPNESEVSEMLEVDLVDFINNDKKAFGEVIARYLRAEVPYFELNGKKVWGATAMILNEFLEVLKEMEI